MRKNKVSKEKKHEYYQRSYPKRKEKVKKYMRDYNGRMKLAVFGLLGNKCAFCGFSDVRALQIDHVNGGGGREKKTITINYYKHVMQELLEGSMEYQLLCANCNWIKRFERNETANHFAV